MRISPVVLLVASCLSMGVARATPALSRVMITSGYLLETGDQPVNAPTELTFKVWQAPTVEAQGGVTPLWTSKLLVDVKAGRYAATLGDAERGGVAFPADLFQGPRWFSVTIGTTELLPRQQIGFVPQADFAASAATAFDLACTGCVSSAEIEGLDGAKLQAGTVALAALAPLEAGTTIEGLDYVRPGDLEAGGSGQVDWSRVANAPAYLRAADLGASGTTTVDWARVANAPVVKAGEGVTVAEDLTIAAKFAGSGSATTAARSDHSHSAAELTGGVLAVARLPVGTTSGTVAAGDDARFSDARTPKPGSADYIQAIATTGAAQAASFNVSGSGAIGGSLFVQGGLNVLNAFPFYRVTSNQVLTGSAASVGGWSWNTAQGVSISFQYTVQTPVEFSARPAEHQALLTAMGRTGVQHLERPFNVYRISWTQSGVWTFFQHVPQQPQLTHAAFTKLESGAISGAWAEGAKATWSLTGTHEGPAENGYSHPHPGTGSATGSILVAMPATVVGYVDLKTPRNWGWFPYVSADTSL